ncbi:MAG: alpha/beta hydrolase [Bdellovibrionales bacterium]|jgi:pimeloyl-ACP methyl ester carboxylesterase|nr:alpha/beta hydrolase [Bdellovibrionales bacterium]
MARVDLHGYGMNVDVVSSILPGDTIFLHGNLASNTWWEPALSIWKANAKPDYQGRFIAAEWRGCGKSEAPKTEEELHPAQLAEDYIQLCSALNIKKANLVGHSTGGIIALYAMFKAPDLFNKVVLLDSVGATGVQFGPEMYAAFTQMSEDRAVCEAVMNGTIHGNDPKNPLFQRIVDDAFSIAKINWHGVPKMLHVTNLSREIDKIQHPALVLHGEHDPVIPVESSKVLAASLPNAKLEILSGQGHSCNVENPELFVSKVNSFLFDQP